MQVLKKDQKLNIEIVRRVFPFKTNNYVVDHLIEWENVPNDPIYILNFSQKDMLKPSHYNQMALAFKQGSQKEAQHTANKIRYQLNPHPAGQPLKSLPGTHSNVTNIISAIQYLLNLS